MRSSSLSDPKWFAYGIRLTVLKEVLRLDILDKKPGAVNLIQAIYNTTYLLKAHKVVIQKMKGFSVATSLDSCETMPNELERFASGYTGHGTNHDDIIVRNNTINSKEKMPARLNRSNKSSFAFTPGVPYSIENT